jgi:hypothetical protein
MERGGCVQGFSEKISEKEDFSEDFSGPRPEMLISATSTVKHFTVVPHILDGSH